LLDHQINYVELLNVDAKSFCIRKHSSKFECST